MDINDVDDEEFGFSRNYFLAKELGSAGKKSTHRLSDIDVVPEEELRAAVANLEMKHAKEVKALMESYRSLYDKWVFELRYSLPVSCLKYGLSSFQDSNILVHPGFYGAALPPKKSNSKPQPNTTQMSPSCGRVGYILPASFLNILSLLPESRLSNRPGADWFLMRHGEPHGFDHNSGFQNNKK
ncbi:hypothetical protein Cgig2_000803 [Carnegiea gigantea]|uniref:Uncharacterized protein n=1 Tax=Carnegiea gigantea TaxID=171969 RepID=A0A9Q1JFA5_9CARY|nr:hypothetical protein Cgig2_000803 [Carnegiea gigantea]